MLHQVDGVPCGERDRGQSRDERDRDHDDSDLHAESHSWWSSALEPCPCRCVPEHDEHDGGDGDARPNRQDGSGGEQRGDAEHALREHEGGGDHARGEPERREAVHEMVGTVFDERVSVSQSRHHHHKGIEPEHREQDQRCRQLAGHTRGRVNDERS